MPQRDAGSYTNTNYVHTAVRLPNRGMIPKSSSYKASHFQNNNPGWHNGPI